MRSETTNVETHRFQAEVSQVLHLVVHSLYSHKEVFLRELVSNASDALDRMKFRAITEPSLAEGGMPLDIRLAPDREAGTLTIEDSGVGMAHDEVVQNLGTIAHSGSRRFLEALRARGEASSVNLIGQFGVGFYSAYLVADRVEVVTRAAGTETAWRWASEASDGFTVTPSERSTPGTSIVLHLKDEAKQFLDGWKIRELVTRYSDFVSYPILLRVSDDERDKGEDKAVPRWDTINRASALWQRPKSDISRDQYEELYKHVTHDDDAPLAWTHFRVEGSQEFVGILYLPKNPPFDMDLQGEIRRGVRLFVKRVFIMDDCEVLVPSWLRFVRGVIDSDDLPLNVSREVLQDSSIVRSIRKQVIKKTLDLLDEVSKDHPEDYKTFWGQFGKVLKEALHTDWEQRERVGSLMRYASSEGAGLTSLADYISRMKPGQEAVYYALGESTKSIAESPHLEALRSRGYEVLYLTDLVDQWAAEGLREFHGKKLVSVSKADFTLAEDDPAVKKSHDEAVGALGPLLARAKAVLGERVKDVRASDRLKDSPCCLATLEGALNTTVERTLRALGRDVPVVKRVLEINPEHPLIVGLKDLAAQNAGAANVDEWIEMLYDQALLTEGNSVDDPGRFARRLTSLLSQAVSSAQPRA